MDSDEPIQPEVGEPAGQQLKKAREKHGLSQKDVADAQHLRVSIIQSIEDGKYEDIASELFLKGYVRAYAMQVGADADALIETLDVELEPLREERKKLERENPLIDIERRRRRKRQVAKTLVWILILVGAAYAGWTFFIEPRVATEVGTSEVEAVEDQTDTTLTSQPESETLQSEVVEPAVDQQEEAEATADSAGSGESAVSVTTPEQTSEPNSAFESQAVVEENTTLEQEPSPAVEPEEVPDTASEEPVVAEAGPETESSNLETVNVEPVVQPDPVFEESAQPEAVVEPARLEMTFVADCWVQITDSSGARLVASLQRAGEQVSVTGRAPLKVIIGAVDAVGDVSFSGEAVNLSDYRVVNNRTEFTLSL
ncbi:RodZ domain-containing protein [Marinobacter sp. CHS3-4]|uniref:RodZ domain-containing protein n=1 Tax=Marinobacter sp. CHS3-4 TaxID=3045174 RepID=UPI0024B51152|nr:RodZ domain-containing protein [Marinobacter sp. CHS3-4]MDI9245227.1 DUF4115 domain-containing protein [Marinobacter sp. CHS3-4]